MAQEDPDDRLKILVSVRQLGDGMMEIRPDDVRVLAQIVGLDLPESDLPDVAARFSLFMLAVEELKQELGEQLERYEPVPPVYPRERVYPARDASA